MHESGGGLRAGPRRPYRRRRGAEADSSGVPGGGGSDCDPETARPCSPRPRAPGPGRGAPAAASPACAPGRCGAGPGARRLSRRVYTPDGGFSPIPFSTSSIRSSSITTAQGESASAARPRGAAARMGPGSSRPAQLLLLAQRRPADPSATVPSPFQLSCRLNPLLTSAPRDPPPPLLVEERPSSKGSRCSSSQSKPSRRLSSSPSELIGKLLLMESLSSTLISTEPPPQTDSPSTPTLSPT